MNKVVSLLIAGLLLMAPAAVFADNSLYPFEVKLNGETAKTKGGNAIFAVYSKAFPANAEIEVAATGQVIVNVFPCDSKGNPVSGQAPAILIFQAPKSSLAKTMDGKQLASGKYLANVVAESKTSRIVFDIQ